MNTIKDGLLSLAGRTVPDPVRSRVRVSHQQFALDQSMRRFRRAPSEFLDPDSLVIKKMVYGWNNRTWSALEDYLVACVDHALNCDGPILECGSGLSTLLLGEIAKQRGIDHWALEHAQPWADRLQHYLKRYDIKTQICTAPLTDYGDYEWYTPPLAQMPDDFSLIVCDGPPWTTKGGRYGLSQVMKEHIGPGCVILLDDVARPDEKAVAERWAKEFGIDYQTIGDTRPYARFELAQDMKTFKKNT